MWLTDINCGVIILLSVTQKYQKGVYKVNIIRMIDLSQELYHNCPVLPEFAPPKLDYILVGPRDGWNLEQLTMNLHTATHMDAPAHMADFRLTLDAIPVERFQGRLVVLDMSGKKPGEPVTVADLLPYAERLSGEPVVFLYTGWGEKRSWTREFIYESPYLSTEGAGYLVEQGDAEWASTTSASGVPARTMRTPTGLC
jgi:kynurenine formamidase